MQKEKEDADLVKLGQIVEKKRSMQSRLSQLEEHQKKCEEDINFKNIMRDRNYSTLRARSELSKEDAATLKKLIQQQQSFEKQLLDKSRLVDEQELAHKLEDRERAARRVQ